ncbi:FKBP-type peptidyl-prolyl cis-trans isomerase [Demequina sp. NBRC 110057]|uniref:FKBP-type peptidyl-prolyl cis-trans isomerase n=1 Tax=Demequina sp. NBRC 110057 TaxID=1570346 RepID=UPI000A0088EC|nr:FKBP-type peptidyl-prolyl cis-trans isomerase [Demequina sp. NBRC 110057]
MRRFIVPVIAAALTLAACSDSAPEPSATASLTGDIGQITVGQSETLAPSLTFEPGMTYTGEQTQVVWNGEGAALEDGQPLLLDLYGESLTDATPVVNTFDGLPQSFVLTEESLGEALYDTLVDLNVGARVLTVSPGDGTEDQPPVAVVMDVRSESAVGDEVAAPDSMPKVTFDVDGAPQVTVAEDAPTVDDLQVATLIKGTGPQVSTVSRVLVNYSAFYYADGENDEDGAWSAGDVFRTSWPADVEPLTIDMDAGKTVTGLTQGILDQTEGSRVELVIPATMGYPSRGTMVVVVDILDVWNSEE